MFCGNITVQKMARQLYILQRVGQTVTVTTQD
jgi:hypothetical protein